MKKVAVAINNKDVLEDWIEDLFNDGFIQTPNHKDGFRSILGYVDNHLVNAEWHFGSNCVGFRVVEQFDRDYVKPLSEMLRKNTNDENSFVYSEVTTGDDTVYVQFWYDTDED